MRRKQNKTKIRKREKTTTKSFSDQKYNFKESDTQKIQSGAR